MKPVRVDINYKTILFITGLVALAALLIQIKQLLILFFVAFILSEALHPTITKLETKGVPRILATTIIYACIIGFLAFALAGLIPIFTQQSQALSVSIPNFLQTANFFGTSAIDLSSQFKLLEVLPANLAKFTVSLFSNLIQSVLILVITFYMVMQRKELNPKTFSFLGKNRSVIAMRILERLESRLGGWASAQLLLMFMVGLLSYVGYVILGIEFAPSLAIIAGILEMVPNIGPVVSSLLAGLVGFTVGSPLIGLLAICWGTVVQQLENHFIVPKVMKETVGLNPLVTIMVLLVGSQLGGVLGTILAIPVFLTIQVTFQEISKVADKPNSV